MMDLTTVMSFTMVAALLVVSPGPNGVLIAKTVPTSGRLAGFANIFGFVVAFYVHGILSIAGISLILVQSAQLFFYVKMLGAAYLCWIGVNSLLASWRSDGSGEHVSPAKRPRTLVKAFGEGFLTNVLNPKVSMFYLAAFPQFITQTHGAFASSFMLVTIHATLNVLWFTAMVVLLGRMIGIASKGSFRRWLKGITGIVFIAFGAKLATIEP